MSSRGPRFRRNGKLFACEPCRKHKIRCDHALPACGRCRRRKLEAECNYHPAPLTRVPNSDDSSPSSWRAASAPLSASIQTEYVDLRSCTVAILLSAQSIRRPCSKACLGRSVRVFENESFVRKRSCLLTAIKLCYISRIC
jgi:hypothetical protein